MRIFRVLILVEDSADKETETTLTYAFQHFISEREIHGKVVEVVRDTEQEKVSRIGYSENTVHFEEYVCDPEDDDESDYEFTCKNETDGPLTGSMALVTCSNCLTQTNPKKEETNGNH